jgi:hypothetical protein
MRVGFLKNPSLFVEYTRESNDFSELITQNSTTEKWGLPERPEIDEMGQPTGVILPAEYTVEIEDITAQVAQQAINAEALAYLASTDWLIIREVDAGVPCPVEIKTLRAEARAKVVR